MTTRRCIIHPLSDPASPIDVTDAVVGAIAHTMWEHQGGNEMLNWLEAERFLQQLLHAAEGAASTTRAKQDENDQPKREAAHTDVLCFPPPARGMVNSDMAAIGDRCAA